MNTETDRLVSDFGRLFVHFYRLLDQRMAAEGASLSRTKIMLFLRSEGPARAVDIADLFGTAPRTVTEAIDGLERDGLVARTPHPTDRRAKLVTLTGEGARVLATTEPLRQRLADGVFGLLDSTERQQFSTIVAKLNAAVAAIESSDLALRQEP